MKINSIFNNKGSLFLAGALAFTFFSCDTDTRSNQSIVREAENQYESETNPGDDVNDPSISYEDGEFQDVGERVYSYDYERDYSYEERDVVIDRVRDDLNRIDGGLEELMQLKEQEGSALSEEAMQEWEETRRSLEERRTQLDQDLQELEQATEDNWENVRNDVNESLIGFEQQWEELNNREFGIEETGTENDDNQEPEVQQY